MLAQVATIPKRSLSVMYQADRGQRISNVPSFPIIGGFSIISGSDIARGDDGLADSYLVVSGRGGRETLTLARSPEQVSQLIEVFSTIFLLSLLPTLGFAGLAGWLSRAKRTAGSLRFAPHC